MNDQLLRQLEQRVRTLEQWKEDRTRQQLVYPLDESSIRVIAKYFLRIIAKFTLVGGAAGRAFNYFFVQQDNFIGSIGEDLSVVFTAATSDILTVTGHAFADDDRVYVSTSDTLPSPLDSTTTYYVISSTGFTFKLSTSQGGSAVNITDGGTGTHYINYL